MIFLPPKLTEKEFAVIEDIESLRKKLGYLLSTPRRWLGLLRRMTLSRAIRGSNTIEGYEITKDDAAAVVEGEEPFDEKTEAWIANECYRRAMTYVLQRANDPYFSYSENLIKSLHYMMMEYNLEKMPGQWRPGYINVVNHEMNEVVYVGPDAELVPSLIKELINYLESAPKDTPSIIHASIAHLNMAMIHPFKDGNGRMARCLQTLVLMRDGTTESKFCSIEEFLGKPSNTRDYYSVLANVGKGEWHPENDASLWVRFCLNAHYIQAMTMVRRTDEIENVWADLEAEVKKQKFSKRTILVLLDAAYGYKVRNSRYRKTAEIEDQLASRDFKKLVDSGMLIPHGVGRGRYYQASDYLMQIRNKSRQKQEIHKPFDVG